ncbi:hypothetical protein ACEN2J_20350 [Pseudorhodobacter sp. W20_MBD10_FR17]|uniref:capsular polysaccharide export protein, LipB/KpsS family n=1 Tax=Pseudorhodobacter sp. W20_MBD10_FR17 TaxID=3240266 RepID=UPI003F9800CE
MRDTITQRKPRVASKVTREAPPLRTPYIFVPLQVPGDSQLRISGGAFKTVEAFVDAILKAAAGCPEGWQIRIKEHPSARPFVKDAIDKLAAPNVILDNETDTFEQVKGADVVLTVNSSVGLEAMFFEKAVVACGDCFWAFDGVAASAKTPSALSQMLSNPTTISFDPAARHAFLTYLDKIYYPKLSSPENARIAERISGADQAGFWAIRETGEK